MGVNGSLDFKPGGGTQGSEGWTASGPTGAWMAENVLELLDAKNEFYHDRANGLLYWAPNVSTIHSGQAATSSSQTTAAAAPPEVDALVAVRGKVLLFVTGDQRQPAKNISLVGLVFRDSAPTFL